jgi:uncharacterized protein
VLALRKIELMRKFFFIVFMVSISMLLWTEASAQSDKKKYATEINTWDEKRLQSLKAAEGWVNLAGLFWLKKGENRFGSDPSNEIVFNAKPFPAYLGKFVFDEQEVKWETAPGLDVTHGRNRVEQASIFRTASDSATQLSFQTFRWTVIQREELVGVRFRDLAHPNLEKLKKIERYKVDLKWKIAATIEPPLVPFLGIRNVLGQTTQQRSAGKVVFELNGKTYKLDVIDEGTPNLFVIFADETNAVDTYPTGRFVYIPRPDAQGNTVIDFNKSYNPPCAFSPHATCPIPPPQNQLPVSIKAGEKNFHF